MPFKGQKWKQESCDVNLFKLKLQNDRQRRHTQEAAMPFGGEWNTFQMVFGCYVYNLVSEYTFLSPTISNIRLLKIFGAMCAMHTN